MTSSNKENKVQTFLSLIELNGYQLLVVRNAYRSVNYEHFRIFHKKCITAKNMSYTDVIKLM